MQCVASMFISLAFLLVHAYVWPYPYPGANILKLITEIQVSCFPQQVATIVRKLTG